MRKLFILLSAALLTSCTTELTEEVFVAPEGYEAATPPVATRAISGAIYNEVLDLWMMPRPGAQTFAATTGQPTHYALKIYPKTEAEQREIEMMKDVQVAYIPFDYVQLTQQEVEQVAHTRSAATTFAERSPYTVTYDNVESTDGGPTGPQTFQLPILYAVWPVEKPLPEMEHVIDHEITRPVRAQTMVAEETYLMGCYLKVYDETLGRTVPLANMRIEYTVVETLRAYSTVTGPSGWFQMETGIPVSELNNYDWINRPCTLISVGPSGQWKIIGSNGTTTPYLVELMVSIPFGRNALFYPNPTDVVVPDGYYNRQVNDIHRAANYFYYEQNDFPKNYPSGGTRIIANSGPNQSRPTSSGNFNASGSNVYINVYNRGKKVVG